MMNADMNVMYTHNFLILIKCRNMVKRNDFAAIDTNSVS